MSSKTSTKDILGSRRSFQPNRELLQHEISSFFFFFGTILACLNPDPKHCWEYERQVCCEKFMCYTNDYAAFCNSCNTVENTRDKFVLKNLCVTNDYDAFCNSCNTVENTKDKFVVKNLCVYKSYVSATPALALTAFSNGVPPWPEHRE